MDGLLNILLAVFLGWLATALAEHVGIDRIPAVIIGVIVGLLVFNFR